MIFLDPWTALTFAEASNSVGEREQDFERSVGGNARAEAAVTFAAAVGLASGLNRTGSGNSAARIPVCEPFQASSVGRGSIVNSFIVTGGIGAVTVEFAADVVGIQRLRTDHCGLLAESEIIVALLVDGETVLFEQSMISIGPNDAADLTLFKRLSATVPLEFNTSYGVFVGADAESRSITTVPEPFTPVLVLVAFGSWVARVRAGNRVSKRVDRFN